MLTISKQNWRKELQNSGQPFFAREILRHLFTARFENIEVEPFVRDEEWQRFIEMVGEVVMINNEGYKLVRKNMRLDLEPTTCLTGKR